MQSSNSLSQVKVMMGPIPLAEAPPELLQSRALQKRVDTKFMFSLEQLEPLLTELRPSYGLLRAGGEAVARYQNLYFDSADFDFLRAHHRGRRPRHKVRLRHYPDRELSYLEVKRKTNADMTVKRRQPVAFGSEELRLEDQDFISEHSPLSGDQALPSFRVDFGRMTLIGLETVERATFDFALCFGGDAGPEDFPGLVVAEVKQDRFQPRSPIMLALRKLGIRPQSMSKYCTAAMLNMPEFHLNRFLPTLRALRRTCHE